MIKHDLPASRGVRYFLCHVGCAHQQSCVNFQEEKNTHTHTHTHKLFMDTATTSDDQSLMWRDTLSFRQNKSPILCAKPFV